MPDMNPISAAPAARISSGKATASLVLGIVGLATSIAAIPAMLAVIFGHLATDETKTGQRSGHGLAVAGLILGYIVVGPLTVAAAVLGYMGIYEYIAGR
jgi:hypothetical protein